LIYTSWISASTDTLALRSFLTLLFLLIVLKKVLAFVINNKIAKTPVTARIIK
jgi:hypothetical protein